MKNTTRLGFFMQCFIRKGIGNAYYIDGGHRNTALFVLLGNIHLEAYLSIRKPVGTELMVFRH